MTDKIAGPTVPRTSLSSRGGMMSEGQFVVRRCITMSLREDRVIGCRRSRVAEHGGRMGSVAGEVCADLRSEILLIKNCWKSALRAADGTMGDASRGLVKELKILNRTCGLWRFWVTRSEI